MGKPSQRELARRKPRLRKLTPETQHMSKFKCSRTRQNRAAGDARFTMTVSIVSMWAFRVGFCYLAVLCFGGGLLSIWMGMYLDWVFRSLCFYLRFRRGSWLEQSVI